MTIHIESILEGAQRAKGNVAIIDVFRAFTTAAVAFDRGADHIVMVSSVEEALSLRQQGRVHFCMGEVKGIQCEGFDFGNSPYQLAQINLDGKIIAQRTSAGTQGIVAAAGISKLYATSLVTAKATTKALQNGNPSDITIVAMGSEGKSRTNEDEMCALYMRDLLEGRQMPHDAIRQIIMAGKEVIKFQDPKRPAFDFRDVELALQIDRYDFAVRVQAEKDLLVARAEKND